MPSLEAAMLNISVEVQCTADVQSFSIIIETENTAQYFYGIWSKFKTANAQPAKQNNLYFFSVLYY